MTDRRAAAEPLRAAAFLDRDGTIVEDVHYLAAPEQLRLLPGAVEAVRALNAAGVPVIIVTNQSGIARGLLTPKQYLAVELRLVELLDERGATITATYHCPHHPDFTGPCECRKPGLGLYRRASVDHALDPARSLFVGDRWRDVEPGLHFGGLGVLVASASSPAAEVARAGAEGRLAADLGSAVARFLAPPPG